MNCSKCRAPLTAHFKIEHVGRDGVATTSAAVCSLTCLLGWGQDYAAHAGMRIAIGVQQKIDSAKRTWDTLKGMFKGS
jgi:hypothetical protein